MNKLKLRHLDPEEYHLTPYFTFFQPHANKHGYEGTLKSKGGVKIKS